MDMFPFSTQSYFKWTYALLVPTKKKTQKIKDNKLRILLLFST